MSIIEVKGLKKEYSYYKKDLGLKGSVKNLWKREQLIKTAVNDISFQIEEGEIIGFLGPNGAGKTTTLKMLSGKKKLIHLKLTENVDEARMRQYGKVMEWNESEVKLEVEQEKIQSIMRDMMEVMHVYDFSVEDIPLESGIALLYQKGN